MCCFYLSIKLEIVVKNTKNIKQKNKNNTSLTDFHENFAATNYLTKIWIFPVKLISRFQADLLKYEKEEITEKRKKERRKKKIKGRKEGK